MVSAPFRERVLFLFGRSKRFRAEDHLPVPLNKCDPNVSVRRIEASFRKRNISKSTLASLAVVLRTCTCRHGYWHCGSPLDCKFRGMIFVCMARSVLVSTVRTLGQRLCGGSVARGFLFLVGFRVCPTFAVMLLLFGAVCSVFVGTGPVWKEACMDWARAYLRNAPVHALGPGLVKLKPEVLQKQVGKLAEEYGAFFVDVTLRDGFIVPQVELFTDIKFLRFLKKEDLAPSIPEVLYFFVKRAKSIQKHLDRNRKNKVRFRLIFGEDCIHRFEWYYRCVKFLPASWKYISATASIGTGGRSSKECDPNVSVRRIEPSFRKGGG